MFLSLIKSWCENLIYLVVIIIIIELLISGNSNKKYIEIILSMFVLIMIINPLNHFDEIDLSDLLENVFDNVETDVIDKSYNENDLLEVYSKSIEVYLKDEIESLNSNYKIENIKIEYDNSFTKINSIEINLNYNNNENYENIYDFIKENLNLEKEYVFIN